KLNGGNPMKSKLFTALSLPLYLLAFNTQAGSFPPEPQKCPHAAQIKSVGVSHNMVQDSDGLRITGRRNQTYGTGSQWTFILAKIPASSVDHAYNKAVDALNSLTFNLGPVMGPLGKWVCYYNN